MQTLSEHLINFFKFFGCTFDIVNKRIEMENGGRIVCKQEKSTDFSLINPTNREHDLGKSAFKIQIVFKVFKFFYYFLMHYNFQPHESILKYLINP